MGQKVRYRSRLSNLFEDAMKELELKQVSRGYNDFFLSFFISIYRQFN